MSMTAEEIAAGLTPLHGDTMLWPPADGSYSLTRCPWQILPAVRRLKNRGLIESVEIGRNGAGADCRYRLTPLGLAVRTILERQP